MADEQTIAGEPETLPPETETTAAAVETPPVVEKQLVPAKPVQLPTSKTPAEKALLAFVGASGHSLAASRKLLADLPPTEDEFAGLVAAFDNRHAAHGQGYTDAALMFGKWLQRKVAQDKANREAKAAANPLPDPLPAIRS